MSHKTDEHPKLKQHTCNTCGEQRDLFSFYDGFHRVWLLDDMSMHIDHGEADPNG